MSEFLPTTYASFYTTHTPFDDYDEDPGFAEELVLSRVPIQILHSSTHQYQPVDGRGTTVKQYNARVRGHWDIRLNYVIEDERTGIRYSIDDIDQNQNPVGDTSWVLSIRKIPTEAGA